MAAMGRLSKTILGHHLSMSTPISTSLSSSSTLLPSPYLVLRRGIATKLFVGGLSFYTTERGLSQAFSQHGQVLEAKIVMDRDLDKSKGFGFVTFASMDEAHKAIEEMNGKALDGRAIVVNLAKPSPHRDGGGQMPIARGPPEPARET